LPTSCLYHNIICRQKLDNISIDSFKEYLQQSLLVLEQEIYKNYRWKRDAEDLVVRLYEPMLTSLMKKYQLTICTTNYDKSLKIFVGSLKKDIMMVSNTMVSVIWFSKDLVIVHLIVFYI
jgi:pantothenate kinase-related protein Tda10